MYWTKRALAKWLSENRPEFSAAEVGGARGFFNRAAGLAASFQSCGPRWRDVAIQLEAAGSCVHGTAPDTSLHLGDARRAWLKSRGGYQPTIRAMIDRAMKRNP